MSPAEKVTLERTSSSQTGVGPNLDTILAVISPFAPRSRQVHGVSRLGELYVAPVRAMSRLTMECVNAAVGLSRPAVVIWRRPNDSAWLVVIIPTARDSVQCCQFI